jgi:hypothetical protein
LDLYAGSSMRPGLAEASQSASSQKEPSYAEQ